jgi:hypothetical protein
MNSPAPLAPENRTAEKQAQEMRRLRGYIAALKSAVECRAQLETLCRRIVSLPPLGMVGIDPYERRLEIITRELNAALAAVDAAKQAAQKNSGAR